jgi:hypothetical protein
MGLMHYSAHYYHAAIAFGNVRGAFQRVSEAGLGAPSKMNQAVAAFNCEECIYAGSSQLIDYSTFLGLSCLRANGVLMT